MSKQRPNLPESTERGGGHAARRPAREENEHTLFGSDLPVGAQVGNYIVESKLARGGFATIYAARHAALGRKTALKLLHQGLAGSPEMVRRFEQEAQAVNYIRHPNIVDIFEFGRTDDGRPFFAMEWLEGDDLDRHLAARGPMSPTEALALMEDLGAALVAAHAVGVIHRDIKASNVIMVPAGGWFDVKLVDFGIAKLLDPVDGAERLTSTGHRLGTPSTMAPEQILGGPVDARTDIYALGLLLYQVLTGTLPFRAGTTAELEELHLRVTPPRASMTAAVPPGIDDLIARCLEKRAEHRPPSVEQFLRALRQAAAHATAAPATAARDAALCDGAALHFEVRVRVDNDEVDDAALDSLERAMALARDHFAAAGLRCPIDTASTLLGVQLLPADAEEARQVRLHVIDTGLRLMEALRTQTVPHPDVQPALCGEVGSLLAQTDPEPRFIGGDLLCLGDWVAAGADDAFVAGGRLVAELADNLQVTPLGPQPGRVRVDGRRGL